MSAARSEAKSIGETKPYQYIQVRINGKEFSVSTVQGHSFPLQMSYVEIYSSAEKKPLSSIALHEINHDTTALFNSLINECPVVFYFEKENVKIRLPETMTKNLVTFFKEYRPKERNPYYCLHFLYEILYGRYAVNYDNELYDLIQKSPESFNEEKLTPGSAVYLYKKKFLSGEKRNEHFAICIGGTGQKSYLSLFGSKGPMLISTLNGMKQAWGADTCIEIAKVENVNQFDPYASPISSEKPASWKYTALKGV